MPRGRFFFISLRKVLKMVFTCDMKVMHFGMSAQDVVNYDDVVQQLFRDLLFPHLALIPPLFNGPFCPTATIWSMVTCSILYMPFGDNFLGL